MAEFRIVASGAVPVRQSFVCMDTERQSALLRVAARFRHKHGHLPESLTDDVGTAFVAGSCEGCGRIMFGSRPDGGLRCCGCREYRAVSVADASAMTV